MAEDIDPFVAIDKEESLPNSIKTIIFISITLLLISMYFQGSGKSISYKKPPINIMMDISGLETIEETRPIDKEKEIASSLNSTTSETSLSSPDSTKEEDKSVKNQASNNTAATDIASASSSKMTSPPQTSVPSIVFRQPLPSKGNWKKDLPNFSSLNRTQRITPIANANYDTSFNDRMGAITISPNLGKPFDYFKNHYQEKSPTAKKLGIIMYGLGLNASHTIAAINSLPAEVSLSFSPYSSDLQQLTSQARQAGHEVLLDIPLQSANYPLTDTGNLSLLQKNTADDNNINLLKMLSHNIGIIGFFSINGEGYNPSTPTTSLLPKELASRGLMFLDANDTAIIKDGKNIDILKASVVIKKEMFKEEIIAAIEQAQAIALSNGGATLAIDTRLLSIYLLRDLIEKELVNNVNIELVPISFLVQP